MTKRMGILYQKFGRWTVVGLARVDSHYHKYWYCLCDCGTYKEVSQCSLKSGVSKSCGCLHKEQLKINEIGNVYGRLTVISQAEYEQKGFYWNCECTCGNNCVVLGSNLRRGCTKSCGCLSRETARDIHRVDETGNKYNKLYVINFSHINRGEAYWNCSCDCGNLCIIQGSNLRRGSVKSCGCLQRRQGKDSPNWKGGLVLIRQMIRLMPEYNIWHRAVLIKDTYTCQYSGIKGSSLQVHHKKPLNQIMKENNIKTRTDAQNCEELWDINNGITLDKKYHKQFHILYGYKCNLHDLNSWLNSKNGE